MAKRDQSFHPKGHDGKTADLPGTPRIPASPVISKNPYVASATSRCAHCGTSDQISGRPGSKMSGTFTCRSCKRVNTINDGRGFEFAGQN